MSPEQVEVVGCVRRNHDLHVGTLENVFVVVSSSVAWHKVVLVAKLQVPLSPAGTVLGTGPIIAVRQEEHETVLNVPLGLSGDDELIDDDLSSIGKVTELGFPHSQSIGMSLSISQFITKNCEFRKMRI